MLSIEIESFLVIFKAADPGGLGTQQLQDFSGIHKAAPKRVLFLVRRDQSYCDLDITCTAISHLHFVWRWVLFSQAKR